jgi:spermidine synthase
MMMMWMLFVQRPRHIVQLGLGSAALTRFCYQKFPDARVTAAELNPNVIAICREYFGLPPNDARLDVREMNALDFVMDPANHGRVDVLQVDLYDEEARGPVLDTPEFYQACADCLRDGGVMTANVFGDFINYDKNLQAMELAFDAVVWLPEVHAADRFFGPVRSRRRHQAALQPARQELGQWLEGVDARSPELTGAGAGLSSAPSFSSAVACASRTALANLPIASFRARSSAVACALN